MFYYLSFLSPHPPSTHTGIFLISVFDSSKVDSCIILISIYNRNMNTDTLYMTLPSLPQICKATLKPKKIKGSAKLRDFAYLYKRNLIVIVKRKAKQKMAGACSRKLSKAIMGSSDKEEYNLANPFLFFAWCDGCAG